MVVSDSASFPGTLLIRNERATASVATAEADLARSVELLREVASGAIPQHRVVRIVTPSPTAAMSGRERHLPGFDRARRACTDRGFVPVVRPTGGRAVAYDETCIVFDLIERESRGAADHAGLFRDVGLGLTSALRGLGVDARLGAVAGEYCPGEFSINARGAVKLIGTSQRAVRGARLLSGMLPLGPTAGLIDVLTEVNAALGLDWEPATFGSLHDEIVGWSRSDVEAALVTALATRDEAGAASEGRAAHAIASPM